MKLTEYKSLIQLFLERSIPIQEFESRYLTAFKAESAMAEQPFEILEELFESVDAYSPLWAADEKNLLKLTENDLRQEAAKALEKIKQYLQESS